MTNRTTNQGQASVDTVQCPTFTWCEEGAGHNPADHSGGADMSPVTATGRRYECQTDDYGVLVPTVDVHLSGDTSMAPALPAQITVELYIHKPDRTTASVAMTLDEADLLRRHLEQLLRNVEHEPAMQQWLASQGGQR